MEPFLAILPLWKKQKSSNHNYWAKQWQKLRQGALPVNSYWMSWATLRFWHSICQKSALCCVWLVSFHRQPHYIHSFWDKPTWAGRDQRGTDGHPAPDWMWRSSRFWTSESSKFTSLMKSLAASTLSTHPLHLCNSCKSNLIPSAHVFLTCNFLNHLKPNARDLGPKQL